MKLTIDVSAILGVLLNQGPRERLIECTAGADFIAPSSLHWEIGNALSGLMKRKKVDERAAIAVVDAYSKIPIQFVEIDLGASISIAGKHGIYAYDAYFVACAKQYKSALLTLDKVMVAVARKENIRVLEV